MNSNIPKANLYDTKAELLDFLEHICKSHGSLVVNVMHGQNKEVFGLVTVDGQNWICIKEQPMYNFYTTRFDSGETIPLPENVTITTIEKYLTQAQ